MIKIIEKTLNIKLAKLFIEYFKQDLFKGVQVKDRYRYYAVFALMAGLGVFVEHSFNGLSLTFFELVAHGLQAAAPILFTSFLYEKCGAWLYHDRHWESNLCVWQVWFLFLAFNPVYYWLMSVLGDWIPMLGDIDRRHIEIGLELGSIRYLPFTLIVGFLIIHIVLKDNMKRRSDTANGAFYDVGINTPNQNSSIKNTLPTHQNFLVNHEGGNLHVNLFLLVYVQVEENYCYLWVKQNDNELLNKVLVRSTLANMLSQLPKGVFIKTHRSYIVNLRYTQGISRQGRTHELALTGTREKIPVSRNHVKEVRLAIEKIRNAYKTEV